jgi:hypothetical protein
MHRGEERKGYMRREGQGKEEGRNSEEHDLAIVQKHKMRKKRNQIQQNLSIFEALYRID